MLGEDSGPVVKSRVWGWREWNLGTKEEDWLWTFCSGGAEAGEDRLSVASEINLGEVLVCDQEEK